MCFLFPFLGSDVLHHCFCCVVNWKAEGSNALPWSCQSVREQETALAWVLVPRASSLSLLLRSWSLMCIRLHLSWVVWWSWRLQRAAAARVASCVRERGARALGDLGAEGLVPEHNRVLSRHVKVALVCSAFCRWKDLDAEASSEFPFAFSKSPVKVLLSPCLKRKLALVVWVF